MFMISCSADYLKNNDISKYNQNNINDYDVNGYTPLMAAIREHDYSFVKLLIEKGADINKPKGSKSFFSFRIEDRPDTNTPLIILVYEHELAKEFLKKWVSIKEECIKLKLRDDCNVYNDDIDYYKKSDDEFNKIFNLLLTLNIKVNYINKDMKSAIFFSRDISIIKKLLKKGANINQQDSEGETILMYTDDYETMKFLLENGADPKIKNNDNKTILDIFQEKEEPTDLDLKIISLLKKYNK